MGKWNKYIVEVEYSGRTVSKTYKTPMKLETFISRVEKESCDVPNGVIKIRVGPYTMARVQFKHDTLVYDLKQRRYRPYREVSSSIFTELRPTW